MNQRKLGTLLMLTAWIAFSASCTQPAAQNGPQTTPSPAVSSQSTPQESASVLATPAKAAAPTSLAGEYTGEFEGASAAVTISGSAPRYTVHFIIGSDGCAGGALGPASVSSSGVLTVRPTDDASCTITMTPAASGFSVQEHQCSNLHGDACAFNGNLHRAH